MRKIKPMVVTKKVKVPSSQFTKELELNVNTCKIVNANAITDHLSLGAKSKWKILLDVNRTVATTPKYPTMIPTAIPSPNE